jgi:hypothetical protein
MNRSEQKKNLFCYFVPLWLSDGLAGLAESADGWPQMYTTSKRIADICLCFRGLGKLLKCKNAVQNRTCK